MVHPLSVRRPSTVCPPYTNHPSPYFLVIPSPSPDPPPIPVVRRQSFVASSLTLAVVNRCRSSPVTCRQSPLLNIHSSITNIQSPIASRHLCHSYYHELERGCDPDLGAFLVAGLEPALLFGGPFAISSERCAGCVCYLFSELYSPTHLQPPSWLQLLYHQHLP